MDKYPTVNCKYDSYEKITDLKKMNNEELLLLFMQHTSTQKVINKIRHIVTKMQEDSTYKITKY